VKGNGVLNKEEITRRHVSIYSSIVYFSDELATISLFVSVSTDSLLLALRMTGSLLMIFDTGETLEVKDCLALNLSSSFKKLSSRISIVSYLVAVTLSLALIKKYKAILVAALISLLFIAFSSNLLSRYSRIIEVTIDKISTNFVAVAASEESVPVSEDRSTSIRLNVEWPRALRALTKNPLLGTGFSSITLATDNDYLRLLGETGAVGFISFIAVLLWLAVTVSMKLPVNKTLNFANMWVVGFAGSFTGILLNAMFIDIFESSKFATMFWLFAGIVVSICTSVNANEEAK